MIVYKGKGRVETLRGADGHQRLCGWIRGADGFINGLLPVNEVIRAKTTQGGSGVSGAGNSVSVANALIHQDFSITGSGPRVEILMTGWRSPTRACPWWTPPGCWIVRRAPQWALASLMRRMGICEERGSSMVDKGGVPGGVFTTARTGLRSGGRLDPQHLVRPAA